MYNQTMRKSEGEKNRRGKINVTISAWWEEEVKFSLWYMNPNMGENVAGMEINTRKMLQLKGEKGKGVLAYLY
jgi:hypothetical protein